MPHGDAARGDVGRERGIEVPLKVECAAHVTCHVTAHRDGHRRWRLEVEVRKKTCHLLEAVERRAGAFREAAQFRLRQVAVIVLDAVEFLDDHEKGCPLETLRHQTAG